MTLVYALGRLLLARFVMGRNDSVSHFTYIFTYVVR